MNNNRIRTCWRPFRYRIEIEADSFNVTLFKRTFPYFGKMTQFASIPMDKIIFCGNNEAPEKSRWLYLSEVTDTNCEVEKKEGDENHDRDAFMHTETIRLFFGKQNLLQLHSLLKSSGAIEASIRWASGIFFKQYVAFTQKWLFHFKRDKTESVPIEEMAFFVKNKNKLYCGYHKQLSVKIYKKTLFDELKQLCYSISKRLSAKGTTYKFGWFHPDRLIFTDSAVVYARKAYRKEEIAYVPYDRIDLVLLHNKNFFRKKIGIFGEQNILPKHSLGKTKASEIVRILKSHGKDVSSGTTFSSSICFFRNWFGRSPKVVCFDDCIVYEPNRLKKYATNLMVVSVHINYSEVTDVIWYKKRLALWGTLVLKGESSSIRVGQDSIGLTIILPDLCVRSKAIIYEILKAKTSAEFKREVKSFSLNDDLL